MSDTNRPKPDTAAPAVRAGYASGEVSERGELLDGSLQLALEGSCEFDGDEWIVSLTLAWPLAESGEAPLAEGDLALDARDRSLFAILDEGTAAHDADTGAAQVTARFAIDASHGDTVGSAGSVECQLEVDVAEWRGELTLSEGAEGD